MGKTRSKRVRRDEIPLVRARPGRSIILPLLAATLVLPILAMLILAATNVPLGESAKLIYRYSPIREERAFRAVPALLVLVPLTIFIVGNARRPIGWLALFLALVGAWTWFAPPAFVSQHEFNFISPAQDGAFVLETLEVTDA